MANKPNKINIVVSNSKSDKKEENLLTTVMNILLAICFIPAKKSDTGFTFSYFSCRFLVFAVLHYFLPVYIFIMSVLPCIQCWEEFMLTALERNNIIDFIVVCVFLGSILTVCPMTSVLVAPMYSKFYYLESHLGMVWPINKRSFLVSFIFFILGIFMVMAGFSFGNHVQTTSFKGIFATLILPSIACFIGLIHWFYSSFLVSSWLSKFIIKCKIVTNPEDTVVRFRNLLSFYHDLDHHLGLYFAFCFTLFQINWIIVMYMGFISPFSEYDLKFTSVYAAGGLIVAVAGTYSNKRHSRYEILQPMCTALIWIRSMSSVMEDAYNSVKSLTEPLETMVEDLSRGPGAMDQQRSVLHHLIRDIDRFINSQKIFIPDHPHVHPTAECRR